MQIGIVGLPYSGKTTLFETITKAHAHPETQHKLQNQQAVIKVEDKRLDELTKIFQPKRKVNATIEVVDMIGLKVGDSGTTQFTNNFLGKVKTFDALIQVVRLFENELVPHPDNSIDPMRDIEAFETEFLISDMALIENRIDKIKKQILKTQDEALKRELPVLEKCLKILQDNKPLREFDFNSEETKFLKNYQLLTIKPMLIALNLSEGQENIVDKYLNQIIKTKVNKHTKVIYFYGKIEMEMADLNDEDVQMFMKEYNIKESALSSIIRESYNLLGLQSFFTVGEDECRAWTIKKGSNAQEAAGQIHSDFYDRFIRAEVVAYDDFIKFGSFSKAKEHGAWRLEGKEYIVKDGDILNIRHN